MSGVTRPADLAYQQMAPKLPVEKTVIIMIGEYKAERVPNKGAVIRVVSPPDGANFAAGDTVEVEIEFDNFEFDQDSKHWHLYVDGQSPRLIMGKSKTVSLHNLEHGQYQISVYLAVGSHTELEDGAMVTINVNRMRST